MSPISHSLMDLTGFYGTRVVSYLNNGTHVTHDLCPKTDNRT